MNYSDYINFKQNAQQFGEHYGNVCCSNNSQLSNIYVTLSNIQNRLDLLSNNFGNYLPLAGGTMSGNINMGTCNIINISSISNNTLPLLITSVSNVTIQSLNGSATILGMGSGSNTTTGGGGGGGGLNL